MNDSLSEKVQIHRSISKLILHIEPDTNLGISNPALNDENNSTISTVIRINELKLSKYKKNKKMEEIKKEPMSPDSEYDEELAIPDSVTIVSVGGENPVLVERKDGDDESIIPDTEIPFKYVYNPPLKFSSFQKKIFIPGVEIQIKIIDWERNMTSHILNPYLYTIQITHGPFTWTVKKRYKHFNALHQNLRIFRASLNFPFPTRSHKERRESFRNTEEPDLSKDNGSKSDTLKRRKGALPRFPKKPDTLIPTAEIQTRKTQLEDYLMNLINNSLYRFHPETISFLEVSPLSFISAIGDKGKEGPIKKRTGTKRPGQRGCNCFGCINSTCCVRCNFLCSDVMCGKWRSRWFFVKESFFGYYRPSDGSIRSIILFDQGFDVAGGVYTTGTRHGLQIFTQSYHLIVKCWTRRKTKDWMHTLKQVANTTAKDFITPNPNNSYVPVRNNIQASWFVDGAGYMSAVADAMENAREEIYIADWWLSPEIYMKRPAIDGEYWRLDKILLRKAQQGVKVFVLLYKEVEMALGINSYYSKQKLNQTHENIKVIRHPDHARVGVFLWAHHEKIVCIDQTYAFLGGIDLCYGRWDDYKHRLTDLGSISTATLTANSKQSNLRNSAFFTDGSFKKELKLDLDIDEIDSRKIPYLEPGDRLLIPKATTPEPCPENTKKNSPEMQRKSMLNKFKDNVQKGKEFMFRLTSPDSEDIRTPGPMDKNLFFTKDELQIGQHGSSNQDLSVCDNKLLKSLDGQAKYWFGKDYANFIMKDFANLDIPYADLVDRTTTPRMPWHDIGAVVTGASARDVARHFIQRWNAHKFEKLSDNITFPYLLPKSYSNVEYEDLNVLKHLKLQSVSCQILRSVSCWSIGFVEQDMVEQSIHEGYIETITNAEHYIYIENQFFITLERGNPYVKNQIAESLVERILRAYRESRVFRVYVVMPLLPGFEGDVGGSTGNALRAITHWNYESISRGNSSILNRLRANGIEDPSEYISFHSLRTNAMLNGYPITELIYVHSKLLIADDKIVICGSANINDRSLIGKRDSEIAVLIKDEYFETSRMNGKTYKSGLYAGKLRKFLFKEHLGLLDPDPDRIPIDVTDPIIDSFWHGMWRRTSSRNTKIYDEVFKCIPTDEVSSFSGMKRYLEEPPLAKTDPAKAVIEVKRIQGYVVDLPLQFLSNEVLTPPGASKEGLVPTSVWT